MTLDPVHVDGIARLASAIADGVDDGDQGDLAENVWAEWLDPLRRSGRSIVEPVAEQRRREALLRERLQRIQDYIDHKFPAAEIYLFVYHVEGFRQGGYTDFETHNAAGFGRPVTTRRPAAR